jgi:hypothetical protein
MAQTPGMKHKNLTSFLMRFAKSVAMVLKILALDCYYEIAK